jgi:hypothetical protein
MARMEYGVISFKVLSQKLYESVKLSKSQFRLSQADNRKIKEASML